MKKVADDDWMLSCGQYNRTLETLTDFERWMYDRRSEVDVITTGERDDLSYEYDDIAILHLDGRLGWATTSGCSCPSPSETWDVTEVSLEEACDKLIEMQAPSDYRNDWARAAEAMLKDLLAWRDAR